MDKHFGDIVVDKLKERRNVVRTLLRQRFKNTQPFNKVKVSDDEILGQYGSLGPQQIQQYSQEYGGDAMRQYIDEMESLKRRKYGSREI